MDEIKLYRCVTLSGLPLEIALEWPIHRSTSGGDFFVLHGDVRLADDSALHALVAAQISVTVAEAMPSMEEPEAGPVVLNVVRKEIDRHQIEFLKSPKRVPVWLSTRYLRSVKQKQFRFHEASDEEMAALLRRKVYWLGREGAIEVADAADALYLGTSPDKLRELAERLASEGLITLDADKARVTDRLVGKGSEYEEERRVALEQLQLKHAFERG